MPLLLSRCPLCAAVMDAGARVCPDCTAQRRTAARPSTNAETSWTGRFGLPVAAGLGAGWALAALVTLITRGDALRAMAFAWTARNDLTTPFVEQAVISLCYVFLLAKALPFVLEIELPEMLVGVLVAVVTIVPLVLLAWSLFGAEVARATPTLSGSSLPVVRPIPDTVFHPLLRGHLGAFMVYAVLYGLLGQLVTCLLLHARKRRGAA
ncbi:MAG TPA: hypothetical protein VK689_06940 [Armatimonadota bacterium]|nr:hypothetical protein [Armatimonadota bacterium]